MKTEELPAAEGTPAQSPAAFAPLVLTSDDVARLLRVKPGTVEELHRTGALPGVKVGKHLRWRPGDVRQFVEKLNAGT